MHTCTEHVYHDDVTVCGCLILLWRHHMCICTFVTFLSHIPQQSLMSTIINLAQTFVGSNNLNLLLPIGQFGTRLHGGKDAASPRWVWPHVWGGVSICIGCCVLEGGYRILYTMTKFSRDTCAFLPSYFSGISSPSSVRWPGYSSQQWMIIFSPTSLKTTWRLSQSGTAPSCPWSWSMAVRVSAQGSPPTCPTTTWERLWPIWRLCWLEDLQLIWWVWCRWS